MKNILKTAFINSFATALYVVAVGSFMSCAGSIKFGQSKPTLVPIFFLMLLVFSAALTGSLVFGRPVMWYLEGKKQEAFTLLAYTLGIFFAIMLLAFVVIFLA